MLPHLILIASCEVNNILPIFQKRILACRFRFQSLCFFPTTYFLYESLKGEIALPNEQCPYLKNGRIGAWIQMYLQNEMAILHHYQFILFAKQHTILIYKSFSCLINVIEFGPFLNWHMRTLFPYGNDFQISKLTIWPMWNCA